MAAKTLLDSNGREILRTSGTNAAASVLGDSSDPCCCTCVSGKSCWQRWTTTYDCSGWGANVAHEKKCYAEASPPLPREHFRGGAGWAVTAADCLTYELWVP